MWEIWSWGRIHVTDLLFANPAKLISEVLIPPFLPYQPRCILNSKIIKASLLLQRSIWEGHFSQAERNHIVCMACVSNVSVLGPGSLSSKWCQNSFDHYTQNHQRTILLHWEQWPELDSHYSQKLPGSAVPRTWHFAAVQRRQVAQVFRAMVNLRNHKWRWTHRGPTKTLASSIPASVFHAPCLIHPYTVMEAMGRAQALLCEVALRWEQSSGWLLSCGSVVLEGRRGVCSTSFVDEDICNWRERDLGYKMQTQNDKMKFSSTRCLSCYELQVRRVLLIAANWQFARESDAGMSCISEKMHSTLSFPL